MNINSTTCSFSLNVTSDESDYVDEGTVDRRRATDPDAKTKFAPIAASIFCSVVIPNAGQNIEPFDAAYSLHTKDENGKLGLSPKWFDFTGAGTSNRIGMSAMFIPERGMCEDFDEDGDMGKGFTDLALMRARSLTWGVKTINVGRTLADASVYTYTTTVPIYKSVHYPSQDYVEDNDAC